MRFSHASRVVLVLLLGFVLLLSRVSDDHLHLCFDGQEPPIALHVQDVGLHHLGMDASQGHADQDVDLVSIAPARFKSPGLNGALLFTLCLLLASLPRTRVRPRFDPPRTIKSTPPFLHPPLRGPPL